MTREILPLWRQADLAVYATPIYVHALSATLKCFLERLLPTVHPFFVQRGEVTRHLMRQRMPLAVILAVAGVPEMSAFDGLSRYFREVFGDGVVAEIYRPEASSLGLRALSRVRDEILAAVQQAGRELVSHRHVDPETLQRIGRPLLDRETFIKINNLRWKACLVERLTPQELTSKGISSPRPESLGDFMLLLPLAVDPKRAGGICATVEFRFAGEVSGVCHFRLENGHVEAHAGPAARPDLTIHSPLSVWADILTGKGNASALLRAGLWRAEGDFALLRRVPRWLHGKA